MLIENVKLSELKLDSSNAREHPKKNIEAIKRSLKRFKQQKPVLISADNIVIAGNGTVMAARELGWQEILATKSELNHKNWQAYAIADNRTAELAAWDKAILGDTLTNLAESGFDLGDIGFEDFVVGAELSPVESTVATDRELLIVVSCDDEKQQEKLFHEFQDRGLTCKIMS